MQQSDQLIRAGRSHTLGCAQPAERAGGLNQADLAARSGVPLGSLSNRQSLAPPGASRADWRRDGLAEFVISAVSGGMGASRAQS